MERWPPMMLLLPVYVPGGLTSSTEIRLLLCYLVKNAGPIARQEIENALMEEALVNYFRDRFVPG